MFPQQSFLKNTGPEVFLRDGRKGAEDAFR